jgi:hypothetical protein
MVSRKTINDIVIFAATIIGGFVLLFLGLEITNLQISKSGWFVVLVIAVAVGLIILYFEFIKKPSEEKEGVQAIDENIVFVKCSCGESFPESKVATMLDFTFRPPRRTKMCPFCKIILEKFDDLGEEIEVDILSSVLETKFSYYVILFDVPSVKRFEKMMDRVTAEGKVQIEHFKTEFTNGELVCTFVSNTDKLGLGGAPKTVKHFRVETVI